MPQAHRLPPHDLFAEQAILSGLLQFGEEFMPQVASILKKADFYDKRHGLIYGAMLWLNEQGSPLDEITVTSRLRDTGHLEACGGVDFVVGLSDLAITPSNMESYAELVSRKAHMRNFIFTASQAIDSIYQDMENPDQTLENAERAIFEVTQKRYSNEIISLEQATIDVVRMLEKRRERGSSGVLTGFTALDRKTHGLQPSDLIIVAGRPSMGKTAFALNVGLNAAKKGGVAVGVFSLEMSREQLVLRLLSGESRVSGEKLRSGFLNSHDYEQIIHAADSLSQVPLYIDDTPSISILELRAKARRLKMQHNLGMIIIDYLQLMRGRRDSFDSREQEISDISRSLKALARELSIPVVALSQLNRKVEDRGRDKRPMLSDLRESGAIEQDADVIAFIYRDIVYNPEADSAVAEIIIGKQRNGPTGTVKLGFIKEFTSFENLAMEQEPEESY